MLAAIRNDVNEKIEGDDPQLRLDYARFLLVQTKQPLSRIAEICGWPNEESFDESFQNEVGVTPAHDRVWHQG